jgi:hypothetical protein
VAVKIKKSIKLTVELDNGIEKLTLSLSPVGKSDYFIDCESPKFTIDRETLTELTIQADAFRHAHMKDEEEPKKETGSIVNLHPEHE